MANVSWPPFMGKIYLDSQENSAKKAVGIPSAVLAFPVTTFCVRHVHETIDIA